MQEVVLGDRVADLEARRLVWPGGSLPLSHRERQLIAALPHGPVRAASLGLDDHALKQVAYRLRRKLSDDVLIWGPGGYQLAAEPTDPDLVGRAEECDAASRQLHRHGAVALVGPGGAGKTRLARLLARQLIGRFDVVWVSAGHGELEDALRAGLGLASVEAIAPSVSGRTPMALLLDDLPPNTSISHWRALADRHRWVLTSRLAVPEVPEVRLSPLDSEAAIALYRLRGGQPAGEAGVAEHDALPLVVELLASQSRFARAGGPAEALRTMETVLDRSWRQLSRAQRSTLGALTVFAGPFSAVDAAVVCGATPVELEALVGHSALERVGGSYNLLDLVRRYALARSRVHPVEAHARWAIAAAQSVVQRLREPGVDEGALLESLEAMLPELERAAARAPECNDRALALLCVVEQSPVPRHLPRLEALDPAALSREVAVEVTLQRAKLEHLRGDGARSKELLAQILDVPAFAFQAALALLDASMHDSPMAEVQAQVAATRGLASGTHEHTLINVAELRVCFLMGDLERGRALGERLLTQPLPADLACHVRMRLSQLLDYGPDTATSVRLLREALDLARRVRNASLENLVLNNLGLAQLAEGQFAQAAKTFEGMEELSRRLGATSAVLRARILRGQVALDRGDLTTCESLIPEPNDNPRLEIGRLAACAALRVQQGRHDEAIALLTAAEVLALPLGHLHMTEYLSIQLAFLLAHVGREAEATARWLATETASGVSVARYLTLLGDLIRLELRLCREPERFAARALPAAESLDRAGEHPEVRRAARLVKARIRPWMGEVPQVEAPPPIAPTPESAPTVRRLPARTSGVRFDPKRFLLETDRGPTVLTAQETRLVQALWDRAGEVVSRQTLLQEVWGQGSDVPTRALDQAVHRLRRRIELDPKAPTVLVGVYGKGYRLDYGASTRSSMSSRKTAMDL